MLITPALVRGSTITVLALSAILGCGGGGGGGQAKDHVPVFKVTGTVTYKGQAVEGALVQIFPEPPGQVGAAGSTNAKGEFQLTTYAANDGAPAGKFNVAITKVEAPKVDQGSGNVDSDNYVPPKETNTEAPRPKPKHLIPQKYSSISSSGLKAIVDTEAPNAWKFDLED